MKFPKIFSATESFNPPSRGYGAQARIKRVWNRKWLDAASGATEGLTTNWH